MVDRVIYAVQTCTNCLPDLNMLISPQFMQIFEEQVWRTVCRRRADAHTVLKPRNVAQTRTFGLSAYVFSAGQKPWSNHLGGIIWGR